MRALIEWLLIFFIVGCGTDNVFIPVRGINGTNGTNGIDGTTGTQGQAGSTGAKGDTGAQGVPGLPGTVVTAVQFCPNYTTTYPSSFPEYGVCINGSLYATYWDGHQAWTAKIVPGDYTTTATGAPCNFKVVSGCTIQ